MNEKTHTGGELGLYVRRAPFPRRQTQTLRGRQLNAVSVVVNVLRKLKQQWKNKCKGRTGPPDRNRFSAAKRRCQGSVRNNADNYENDNDAKKKLDEAALHNRAVCKKIMDLKSVKVSTRARIGEFFFTL